MTRSAHLTVSIAGVLGAIAITTILDATGLSAFSALPLCPLMLLLRYVQNISWRSIGFVWGRPSHYLLAMLYPVGVLGVLVLLCVAMKAVDISHTDWEKAGANFGLVLVLTILVAVVTEEGFFRGWFWASLAKAGEKTGTILIGSSVAFALWHLSAMVLNTGFNPPPVQVPVFIINAAVIGMIWGLLRWTSDSIIVTSVSHGLWNGGAYVLFGFGSKAGALGIKNAAVYGPEIGLLGLALNVTFAVVLWVLIRSQRDYSSYPPPSLTNR
ncbi:MAG TPA: CPBP family intramembrane glutamic endopeptidase [Candidatus Udaeobacter sp.]|nr:CPBP family intramembrane glutamic endopeptidase [Candidatus Udaeobacter sp.]